MNETILQEVGLIRAQLQQIQDNQEVGKLENDKGIISLTDVFYANYPTRMYKMHVCGTIKPILKLHSFRYLLNAVLVCVCV